MLNLFKFLFFFAAAAEGGLYLWDSFGPEVMLTDTWSVQEFRLVILILSSIAFVALHLQKEEA